MEISDIDPWIALGRKFTAGPGVHRPSTFSAFLAATMGDCRDRVVVDAGCGAGLVAVAALQAGARHVIAQDYDGAALADTARNVTDVLGADARSRLTLWEADWSLLAPMRADVLAVKPQRPARLLPDVPAAERHLHEGGGVDGLDALRLILAHAGAERVRTTAAGILGVAGLDLAGWGARRRVATADLPFDRAWHSIVPTARARVDVWEFSR